MGTVTISPKFQVVIPKAIRLNRQKPSGEARVAVVRLARISHTRSSREAESAVLTRLATEAPAVVL